MRAAVPGADLYYEVAGDGPPLLSVSGSGSALRFGIGPATSPLRKDLTVVGYDHRGVGESVDLSSEPPTMDVFARDALALADRLGWDRFALHGLSFGGMVAQHVAALAPDRVTALSLACTSAGGAGGASYPLHEIGSPFAERMTELIDTRTAEDAELREFFLAFLSAGDPAALGEGYQRQMAARKEHDAWDRLPLITAPTLVGSGRYDAIAPPANGAALAGRIPGAEHRVYEGGHAYLFQDPAAASDLRDFLLEPR
ncbi:MAG: alpha/beta fold hydrolase [Mycobacteriales bacterium]|nr:alpha/beta fold hydrolase [Mycobacteriales bacterium]